MTGRERLAGIASRWISLWRPPVDRALFDELHADDFEDRSPAGRPATKEGFARGLADLLRVFPGLRAVVEDLVIDEERSRVAVRWSARGTAVEAFLGREPDGRPTAFSGIEIIEIRGDRIVRRWGEWDVTPEPGRSPP